MNLGYVELRRANFEQARGDFAKALELNRDIPAPHHALGALADQLGRGAEAEAHYRAALRVDPGFAPARANLARRLFARGQYENAREQYQRLVESCSRRRGGMGGRGGVTPPTRANEAMRGRFWLGHASVSGTRRR